MPDERGDRTALDASAARRPGDRIVVSTAAAGVGMTWRVAAVEETPAHAAAGVRPAAR